MAKRRGARSKSRSRFKEPAGQPGNTRPEREHRSPPAGPSGFRDRAGKMHGKNDRPDAQPGAAADRHSRTSKKPSRSRRLDRPGGKRGEEGLLLKATVDKNHKGFGFLAFENRQYEDAFVPPRQAQHLFHGDRVQVELSRRGKVLGIEVLEHRFRELVGRYSPHPSTRHRSGWVTYERKRAREEIFVPSPDPRAAPGDWVRARLVFHPSGPHAVTAEITEVYGPDLPASADIGMVASEYSLVEEHSNDAEAEACALRLEIPGRALKGRDDMRTLPLITIDGETARDFDDAVHVERDGSGYILWVAIADVSHYVTEGSALDREARSRGTSVYFPERAFHMLPRALSENLCSLRPHEPRLAMVARIRCDRAGKRTGTEISEAVIESHRRATYTQIEAELNANRGNGNWEYAPHFELYQLLRALRRERGSIDFDLPEAEIRVDSGGEVTSITRRPRLDAHRLIEEFMIAANEAVTAWMMERAWPFVYRVHEEPAEDALARFQELADTMGVRFRLDANRRKTSLPQIMSEMVRRLEGHPAQGLLNMALLRSLKQAVYSSIHGTHFGLASEGYTHFTSPIRRYPDLVVHRLLRRAIRVMRREEPGLGRSSRERLERELAEICEHCSYRERLAADAEREAIRLKQVRAMLRHVGGEFDGEIVGMVNAGVFVQLDEPYCEGLVARDTMTDDFYEFDEDRMIFVGRRTRRQHRIGDRLRVRVLRADIDKRQIDFGMLARGGHDGRAAEISR